MALEAALVKVVIMAGEGAISKRSKSGLAEDEFSGKSGSGLESSMIARRIKEILVLSAYSKDVILINPDAFYLNP
jgi:hypothetical protein